MVGIASAIRVIVVKDPLQLRCRLPRASSVKETSVVSVTR